MRMPEWLNRLSKHEKRILLLGVMVVLVVLFYLLFITPLANKVKTLRQQVQSNKALVIWMADAQTQLQIKSEPTQLKQQSEALLPLIDKSLKQYHLDNQVTKTLQVNQNQLIVNFDQVVFNTMIAWLESLEKQDIFLMTLSVSATGKSGIVSAKVTLRSA